MSLGRISGGSLFGADEELRSRLIVEGIGPAAQAGTVAQAVALLH